MRAQVLLELLVALGLSLHLLGCAASAEDDIPCTPAGIVTSEAGARYTAWVCSDGTLIFVPWDECRDNPDSNCKEA